MTDSCGIREERKMEKDTCWKEYFSDNRRYADLINGLGCGGKRFVTECDLQELDTQIVVRRRSGRGRKRRRKGRRIRTRDMVRKAAFGVNFAVIGIESQENIDYSMPLRSMVYDAGGYERQADEIRRKIRDQKKIRDYTEALSPGEYLYDFGKDSRLHPVVTFLLYSGVKEWDGPKSLHGMIDFTDIPPEMRELVSDYHVNLIEIRKFQNTKVFKTDVKQVFDFIRCAEDKEALAKLVEGDPYFREMEEDAYDVVTQYANAKELVGKKDYYRRKGKMDMCTAIREMVQDGINQGLEQGIDMKTRRIVENMIGRGMSDEDIMAIAECSEELIREVRDE